MIEFAITVPNLNVGIWSPVSKNLESSKGFYFNSIYIYGILNSAKLWRRLHTYLIIVPCEHAFTFSTSVNTWSLSNDWWHFSSCTTRLQSFLFLTFMEQVCNQMLFLLAKRVLNLLQQMILLLLLLLIVLQVPLFNLE